MQRTRKIRPHCIWFCFQPFARRILQQSVICILKSFIHREDKGKSMEAANPSYSVFFFFPSKYALCVILEESIKLIYSDRANNDEEKKKMKSVFVDRAGCIFCRILSFFVQAADADVRSCTYVCRICKINSYKVKSST